MKDHWGYDKDQQPDIVEVVRCERCRYAQKDEIFGDYWCDGVARRADFFCADGKPKDTG